MAEALGENSSLPRNKSQQHKGSDVARTQEAEPKLIYFGLL